jgi:hypothetical protein
VVMMSGRFDLLHAGQVQTLEGGDCSRGDLPERRLVEGWGARPYIEGRSTTRLLEGVVLRGGT